ncbi:hypothetical protein AB6A40_000736 [Gnathostoma spinigerum]|uniref:polyribonucleotide nucleotidyltransferase n=1 Tax=Gnathostoma spinigerum TaxID=75299 RepID=A0ABD6EBG7_9BILA
MKALVMWPFPVRLISRFPLCRTHRRWTSCRVAAHLSESSTTTIEFETGHIARFADGAVVASHGSSAVLATVVSKAPSASSSSAMIPLTVDFKQSASALGRIPTNYLRRELQQTDADILASRVIDRSIRPLFPKGYNGETQVTCKPLALDTDSDGVILGLNAVSAALAVSDIPWNGPIGAVRLGIIDKQIIVNPSLECMKRSTLNLIIAACDGDGRVVMIEMDGKEISVETFEECLNVGLTAIRKMTNAINDLRVKAGKQKKTIPESDVTELEHEIEKFCEERLYYVLTDVQHDKISRDDAIEEICQDVLASFTDEDEHLVRNLYGQIVRRSLRQITLESRTRCDGRSLNEFRPISMEVDVYKKLHGSALFRRGQTQVLGTVTFDAPSAAFHPDSISQLLGAQRRKMFMLHYEFPSFATNEIASSRRANRRELGHGALAEKALKHLMPEEFPYSVRLACQVMESNGSSSMASVCVGTLALMDAGVPLSSPAAGLAIGMFSDTNFEEDSSKKNYVILTDLLGIEDYAGDMDFKLAGTSKGFTAMQLDCKLPGISSAQMHEAIIRGKEGIDLLLKMMSEVQAVPRREFKSSVPVIDTVSLPIFKRQILFRNGGYNAKLIQAETGVKIDVEDESNISMTAPNREMLALAKEMMNKLLDESSEIELNFGALYKAEIVEILENGVMVTLKKGMRPILLKNSNLDSRRVVHASALGLQVGSIITVQYLGRDSATGHHRISRKLLQSASLPVSSLDHK